MLLLACAVPAAADELVSVLSSRGGAYMEAFSAFQEAYGGEVKSFVLPAQKPVTGPETRVLAAFGGKAASLDYPPELNMVYCMAPGISIKTVPRAGKTVKISMIPAFTEIFSRIKLIQPSIRRLRVFWMAPDFGAHAARIITAGAEYGIDVSVVEVGDSGVLSSRLRESMGLADAFWVPPDPLLLTPENMMMFREFSWANNMPFYGSSKGVTRGGAVASVGVSFADIGAAAAKAAIALNAGDSLPAIVFPEKVELTLNATAAKKCGLTFPKEMLRGAGYLFP